jgi:hypothetical protein
MNVLSLRPHVIVSLDRKRKLRFDMNAIAEAETVLQVSILGGGSDNVFAQMKAGKGNIRFLRGLLWAGLLWEDPELTLQQAGNLLLNIERIEEATDGVKKGLELFFQSLGKPKALEPTETLDAETTGSGSGASEDLRAASA